MRERARNALVLTSALALTGGGCSAPNEDTSAESAGAPGSIPGYGGAVGAGIGGSQFAGGTSAGIGGAFSAGGTTAGVGGGPGPVGAGGAPIGMGGTVPLGSGGDINPAFGGSGPLGSGGLPSGSGGAPSVGAGGDVPGTGGLVVVGSGGTMPQGGTGGIAPTGGFAGANLSGGAPGAGGAMVTAGAAGLAGYAGDGGATPLGGAGGTGGQTSVGACSGGVPGGRIMECLDRGVVAVNQGSGTALVSWRLFGTDPAGIGFNVYREVGGSATQICSTGPAEATNCVDSSPSTDATYFVRPVLDGQEGEPSGSGPYLDNGYLSIPLQDAGDSYVHLAWVGDLDGDGELDYVVDRIPNTAVAAVVDAYRRDGTFLWRIDLGPNGVDRNNIEGGPTAISNGHWDGLTVFDFDSDGRAEVAIKTANGVVFGDGTTLQHNNDQDQFVSIVHGETGAEIARTPLPDDYLVDGPLQCHFGAGYLDGVRPSVVTKCKNRVGSGAFNLVASAYDFDGATVTRRWKYLRGNQGGAADYHQIRVVDVDSDGRDELADGGYVVDENGQYLYGVPTAVHGDRFHIGDLDPDRPGLEGFGIQQDNPSGLRFYTYDAATGEVIRAHTGDPADMARGTAADLDPRHRGYEYWTFDGLYTIQDTTGGALINEPDTPWPNFRIWWDGDALSELLNQNWVAKWNYEEGGRNNFIFRPRFDGLYSWRDAVPAYGDYFGDWREEILMESPSHDEIRIFTTGYATDLRLYTLLHNPEYRNCLTVHGYRQSTMVDYYLGDGMSLPPPPNIDLAQRAP